jgi:hypothetical protein
LFRQKIFKVAAKQKKNEITLMKSFEEIMQKFHHFHSLCLWIRKIGNQNSFDKVQQLSFIDVSTFPFIFPNHFIIFFQLLI